MTYEVVSGAGNGDEKASWKRRLHTYLTWSRAGGLKECDAQSGDKPGRWKRETGRLKILRGIYHGGCG